jgi:Tol biopolymer transport system component
MTKTRYAAPIATLIALSAAPAVLLLAGCQEATPVSPPPAPSAALLPVDASATQQKTKSSGHIVFARGDGLFIMNANGTALRQLTTCGCDILPAVSPDGQRVAFTRFSGKSDTYVMNVDGTGVTRLTENAGNNTGPAWSPDGTRIAFSSDRDGDQEIYVMNADGTGPVRLTTSPGSDFSPTWSPDGTHIAFVSDRAGGADLGEIFVMNADGTHVSQVAEVEAADGDLTVARAR